ncbi:LysR family transcriptional regulator [Jiangella aurantiaca]|uniref:LysR family transcriptional regulator n=1 Tax=Jiangella aurantiaca TaxID=2530373 RepID=A0A4R5ABM1_9ACTN|nr:LysR substrate-binding domain-containing protein [Jiangella aurantiaca]TDD69085.1 LysR family transcriptional regulator [Jiangella aurantiaca]
MLDVRRLRLLRELAVRGTIADVAAALHQSPSSVSQQLTLLEKEAGVPLLRKVGRRLLLTPQAEILVEHTAAVLQRLEEAESDLRASLQEATGTVRIAVFQSAALALMPDLLHTLAERHPRLRVTMTQREPETALMETFARDFDLVVAEQYPNHAAPWHPELDRVGLTRDAIRLAVPPGPEWAHITRLADTAGLPWVVEPHGAASRHFAEQACRQAGFEPDVRFETADLTAQIELIETGNAVALIPDLMWARRPPSVRLVDLDGVPHRTVFTAARRSMASRPSILACREALAAAVEHGTGRRPD